jgi:alpha-galactosidase
LIKIAFIGAGSVVFTKHLLTDVFKFPELRGTTVALHDIDPERLALGRRERAPRPQRSSRRL